MTTSSLTPWSPSSLWNTRAYRLLDQAFNDFLTPMRPSEEVANRAWSPAVDIQETDEALTLTAELPGLKKEDVSITLENGILTLSGERQFEHEDKRDDYHRIERAYGRFTRSFTLPSNVDGANVKARFEDGLLRITLPKAEEARPRTIQIG